MAGEFFKNLDDPDEIIELPGVSGEVVEIGELTVARVIHEPGWRWSTHIRPEVGGEWCQARHVGVMLSGRFMVVFPDGRELEFGPNDVYEIPPGHDGFVIGEERAVVLEWAGIRTFAGSHQGGVLMTLLFTDLVDSTTIAARLGDGPWRELLTAHYQALRTELDRSGGREVHTTGDGILAAFDGPAASLRCASAIRASATRLDLHIRAGIHIGEVQVVGDDLQGLAVHEAARIMSAAGPDEILVSEPVAALASGMQAFEDRGLHQLKGIAEPRRLFACVDR